MAERSRSAFTLRSDAAVGYSPAERRAFALLREEPDRRDSLDISRRYYGGGAIPFHGRKIVIGLLRSLVRKTEANGEPFRIGHTGRSGPIPMSFWLCRRPGRRPAVSSRPGSRASLAGSRE